MRYALSANPACLCGSRCRGMKVITEDDGYPRRGDLDRKWDDQLKEPA
jgi:hypothetical protein